MSQSKIRKRRQLAKAFTAVLEALPPNTIPPVMLPTLIEDLVAAALPETNPSLQARMVGALSRAMQMDIALNVGQITKFATEMLAANYLPEEVDEWYKLDNPKSFWFQHWMSRGGKQPPSERDFRKTVCEFSYKEEAKNAPIDLGDE